MSVTSIRPDLVPPGEVDPDMIEALEALLAKARAGEVRALAYVALREPDMTVRWFRTHPGLGNATVGLLTRLTHDLMCTLGG